MTDRATYFSVGVIICRHLKTPICKNLVKKKQKKKHISSHLTDVSARSVPIFDGIELSMPGVAADSEPFNLYEFEPPFPLELSIS